MCTHHSSPQFSLTGAPRPLPALAVALLRCRLKTKRRFEVRNDLDKKNAVTVIDAVRGPLRGAAPSSACAGSGITRCKLKIKRRLQCEKTNDKEKEKMPLRYMVQARGPR